MPQQRYFRQPGTFPPPRPVRRRTSPIVAVLGALAVLTMLVLGVMVANSLFNRDANVAYANEDYTPPPVETPNQIPIPQTYPELDNWLYNNPANDVEVSSPVQCDIGRIDPRRASDRELANHFEQLMGCEMTVWDTSMQQAGWQLFRPSVTVYSRSISTPCGEMPRRNAAYCSANQQLYYSSDLVDQPGIRSQVANPTAMDMVMAHEFGHSLQGRTGQFAAATIKMESEDDSGKLLLSRMLETQADCYAGLYLNSAAQTTPYTARDLQNFMDLADNLGSDKMTGDPSAKTTHPRGQARRYWMQMGLSTAEVGKCSTYNVSDERLTN